MSAEDFDRIIKKTKELISRDYYEYGEIREYIRDTRIDVRKLHKDHPNQEMHDSVMLMLDKIDELINEGMQ